MPRSIARPRTPCFSADWMSSGNNVTTSMCMVVSEVLGPIHHELPGFRPYLPQMLGGHGYPVFAGTLDHHHRVARRVDEMVDHTQQRSFQILRFETDQVI